MENVTIMHLLLYPMGLKLLKHRMFCCSCFFPPQNHKILIDFSYSKSKQFYTVNFMRNVCAKVTFKQKRIMASRRGNKHEIFIFVLS